MKFIKKILVPTDFSDLSLAAMDYASSFSKIYDADIYMIHVVDNIPVLAFHTVDLNSETILRDAEDESEKQMARFLSENRLSQQNIVPVVRRGDACKEIVEYAEDGGFDLIIMATHGRTGLAHILMGSIAESIVRYSSVPVMTVKPEEMQNGFLAEKDIKEQLHIQS